MVSFLPLVLPVVSKTAILLMKLLSVVTEMRTRVRRTIMYEYSKQRQTRTPVHVRPSYDSAAQLSPSGYSGTQPSIRSNARHPTSQQQQSYVILLVARSSCSA